MPKLPLIKPDTKTDINWKNNEEKEKEWAFAESYFRTHPDEVKLERKSHKDQINHSFIQFNNGLIVAVSSEDNFLTDLTAEMQLAKELRDKQSKVKLAVNKDGQVFCIKRQCLDTSKRSNEIIRTEEEVSKAIGYAKVSLDRHRENQNDKNYILFCYQGQCLYDYLGSYKDQLSESQQFDLAIDLFLTLYQLHQMGWVHLDLKPDNITIDEEGRLHLIDFAFSEQFDRALIKQAKGTPLYIPINIEGEKKERLDLYAALRTLGFPKEHIFNFQILMDNRLRKTYPMLFCDREDIASGEERWIFSDSVIDNNDKLHDLLKKASGKRLSLFINNTHADDIALQLILIRNKINFDYGHLITLKNEVLIKDTLITTYQKDPDLIDQNYFDNLIPKNTKIVDSARLYDFKITPKSVNAATLKLPFFKHKDHQSKEKEKQADPITPP